MANLLAAEPITILVRHFVKPDCQDSFLKWNDELKRTMSGFQGFLGQIVFPPNSDASFVYHIVFRFASIEDLHNWWNSKQYSALRAKLPEFVEREPEFQYSSGLEHWFPPPNVDLPTAKGPPTYKMAIVVYIALMPLLLVIQAFAYPFLSALPQWAKTMIGTALSVTIMSYLALPLATKVFRPWLYSSQHRSTKHHADCGGI